MNDNERYILAPWHKKKNLEYLYYELGMSMRDMAKHYNCHYSTIRKWMIKHGLERRGPAGTATKYNNRMYRNRFYLHQQYLILCLSLAEIAEKEHISPSSVRRFMIKYRIPRRYGTNQYVMRKLKDKKK